MTEPTNSNVVDIPRVAPGTPGAARDALRLIVYSAIGIAMFFVPITVNGKSSIPLDHLTTAIRELAGPVLPFFILALILFGTIRPFVLGTWNASPAKIVFSLLNFVGLAAAVLILTSPPGWLAAEDIGPFLWDKLVVPVGILVPLGAVFLGLLVGFGLMEFVGVFLQTIMKPIWRVPGRSAVDAVASFVGSYSLGLLITNRVYKDGRYTSREAAIIATGFSTVSATFMIVIATTLGIMDHWLEFFFISLIITFVVTAITVRIPPLSRIPDDHHPECEPKPELPVTSDRFAVAWSYARGALREAGSLPRVIWSNLWDGLVMTSSIVPSILSVGMIGLLLNKHTPLIDWAAWIFYPLTWITQLGDPLLAGKAITVGLLEVFLPAALVGAEADPVLRFTIAVVSVSGIIFFSSMVPSIFATDIPVKMWHLVVVWFERVVLTVLLTAPIAHLLF